MTEPTHEAREPVIQLSLNQAFAIIKDCHADQAIEIKLLRAEIAQKDALIAKLTPKPKKAKANVAQIKDAA